MPWQLIIVHEYKIGETKGKIFSETKGKNGLYGLYSFSVNCLFRNFCLNLPFITRSFYFLKKEVNLTSPLSYTRLLRTPID